MIKALFLLAGSGSRLRPLTNDRPKSLIEINGKNLLSRSLDYLKTHQITSVVIVSGYMHQRIEEFISENYPDLSVEYIHNHLFDSTNNSYSLYLAEPAFNDSSMLLMDGDILYDRSILKQVLASDENQNILAVRAAADLGEEEMKVILNGKKQVTDIEKKLPANKCYGESLGIAKFSKPFTKKLFTVLDQRMNILKQVNEFYEASFQQLIDEGEIIEIVDTGEYKCCEIDTIDDLNYATEHIAPIVDS